LATGTHTQSIQTASQIPSNVQCAGGQPSSRMDGSSVRSATIQSSYETSQESLQPTNKHENQTPKKKRLRMGNPMQKLWHPWSSQ
jgi:hypothetical protein